MTIGIDVRLWKQTGIGRYIRNLVSELGRIDKENQYVLFARTQDIGDIKLELHDLRLTIIPTDIKWHSITEQIKFPRLLNKYNLDLVHFPYFSVPVFYNKPFVVTVHDLIINHFPTGKASTLPLPLYKFKRMGYEFILKKAIHDAKKIIVPSNTTREEIVNLYKTRKDKIMVTPEGIDPDLSDFKPVIFKSKKPYFLYVGNAYPHKNLESFLEAFKLFTVTNPGFVVKLVGKEDYFYKKLKERVRKENIRDVEFLGFIPDEDLANLYSQAQATFVPSLMEGFGLTAIEAMSMKSLVAASKIPSLSEVCSGHVLYFDPANTLSIVSCLQEVVSMSDADRKKMIEGAKKHAETFSWTNTAKLTLDVYNSCIHNN